MYKNGLIGFKTGAALHKRGKEKAEEESSSEWPLSSFRYTCTCSLLETPRLQTFTIHTCSSWVGFKPRTLRIARCVRQQFHFQYLDKVAVITVLLSDLQTASGVQTFKYRRKSGCDGNFVTTAQWFHLIQWCQVKVKSRTYPQDFCSRWENLLLW